MIYPPRFIFLETGNMNFNKIRGYPDFFSNLHKKSVQYFFFKRTLIFLRFFTPINQPNLYFFHYIIQNSRVIFIHFCEFYMDFADLRGSVLKKIKLRKNPSNYPYKKPILERYSSTY